MCFGWAGGIVYGEPGGVEAQFSLTIIFEESDHHTVVSVHVVNKAGVPSAVRGFGGQELVMAFVAVIPWNNNELSGIRHKALVERWVGRYDEMVVDCGGEGALDGVVCLQHAASVVGGDF